jgi:8-oxo-dGTP pyrophosphatase MutT (NUDIX family)
LIIFAEIYAMQHVIFYKEKPIYITSDATTKVNLVAKHENCLLQDKLDFTKQDLFQHLENDDTAVVIFYKDEAVAKDFLFKQFKTIEAAGGIVQNEHKELLFIFRRGKWDLPKGKMEKGETEEESALREVEEETGVQNLTLKRKVGKTFHIYSEKDKDILKVSHWFYFTCAKQNLVAQTEEDITEATWVATQNIKVPMLNTFENIKHIMHQFFDVP